MILTVAWIDNCHSVLVRTQTEANQCMRSGPILNLDTEEECIRYTVVFVCTATPSGSVRPAPLHDGPEQVWQCAKNTNTNAADVSLLVIPIWRHQRDRICLMAGDIEKIVALHTHDDAARFPCIVIHKPVQSLVPIWSTIDANARTRLLQAGIDNDAGHVAADWYAVAPATSLECALFLLFTLYMVMCWSVYYRCCILPYLWISTERTKTIAGDQTETEIRQNSKDNPVI